MNMPMPSFAAALSKPKEIGSPKSIMLYGAPGTRKTTLTAELIKRPGVQRILFIDIDNGTEALVGDPEVSAALQDGRIQVLAIDSLNDGVAAAPGSSAFDQVNFVIQEVANTALGYDFVVLDTLNLMQEVAIKHFLSTTTNSSGKLDSRAAWGEVSKWTDSMARMLHNSPHTTGVFIMHEKNQTEETGKISIVPKLSGGAKDSIASIPSIVVHLDFEAVGDEGGVKLVASLGDSERFVSKNRYRLPARIEDFSLLKMYELIDGVRGVSAPVEPEQLAA